VNWLLMVVTIALTVGFGKSDNLAVAYGIAVSATMLMTSFLLLIAMREIWQLSLPASVGIAGIPRDCWRSSRNTAAPSISST
jgi:KUP system potassium uptake protein